MIAGGGRIKYCDPSWETLACPWAAQRGRFSCGKPSLHPVLPVGLAILIGWPSLWFISVKRYQVPGLKNAAIFNGRHQRHMV